MNKKRNSFFVPLIGTLEDGLSRKIKKIFETKTTVHLDEGSKWRHERIEAYTRGFKR